MNRDTELPAELRRFTVAPPWTLDDQERARREKALAEFRSRNGTAGGNR